MEPEPITCLCPTVNRFEALRDAVACFLLQDYIPRKLIILADGEPLHLTDGGNWLKVGGVTIQLIHHQVAYETLGHKRQALLELAHSPIVAHWDDDDWYFPWHLSQCAEVLHVPACRSMVKPKGAWWVQGSRDEPNQLEGSGPHHNRFEGALVFDREEALDLGGYPPKHSGQAAALMDAFKDAGEYCRFDVPKDRISYCYRWNDGHTHVSTLGNQDGNQHEFARRNDDAASGRPVIPDNAVANLRRWAWERMRPLWTSVVQKLPVPKEMQNNLSARLALSGIEDGSKRV